MTGIDELHRKWLEIKENLGRVVFGQENVKERLAVCLFAGGHGLLEGVPGTAKTLLVLAFSRLLGCRFKRIQFTPDLMPADILGTNMFSQKTGEFEFHPGPLFTDILLADEINRTPPRTQAALLEVMQEKGATLDGVRHEISTVFTVFATQNPVEFEGTYPLPEAQRDRFLLKISIDYPVAESELAMLEAHLSGRRLFEEALATLEPVLSLEDLAAAQTLIATKVHVDRNILEYIRGIVQETRQDASVQLGAGPRASLALLDSSRALAALRGREFITPDDVKELAGSVLIHRVILSPESEMEGLLLEDVLRRIFDKMEVPR